MVYSIENGYSKKELQILNWCIDLSYSNGFYGRLEKQIQEDRDLLRYLGNQDFDDILDMVMFIEC